MSLIKSSRGRDMLLLLNHTFSKHRELKSGEILWRCIQKNIKCPAKVYTIIGSDPTITRSELVHNHEVDRQRLQRKIVTSVCKRKAEEDTSEKPTKIIRRAVAEAVATNDFDALKVSDVAVIRRNIYNCRRKLVPGPLPKDVAEVHDDTVRKQCVSSMNLNATVSESDPELWDLIQKEKRRQLRGLEMIASENFTSVPVLQCLSSCLHNKYSEGLPGQRYYGGNQIIDQIEILAQKRALEAYGLDPEEWGVNVQPYSGSPANFAVYTGIVEPHGRIMGLDLPDGGHLTHGFFTPTKKVSATSIFFESMPYKVNPETGLIDYDELHRTAKLFKPKIIIAGVSCYSRPLDYKRFREICDDVGAYLFSDMAHISGLVAAGVTPSPFQYSDVVSTTTHKSLRGPRAGVIFFRKGVRSVTAKGKKIMYDLENRINQAVFPCLQGGPHNNAIAGIATAMKQAKTPEFVEYAKQIVANAKRLSDGLQSKGYKVVTGGTELHMLLLDLRSVGLTGAKGEYILEEISIACNKNTVPGDKSAMNPSGIRLGTPALTTRGLKEEDIDKVIDFIDQGLKLGKKISTVSGPEMVEYKKVIHENKEFIKEVADLRIKVEEFGEKFPLPGYPDY